MLKLVIVLWGSCPAVSVIDLRGEEKARHWLALLGIVGRMLVPGAAVLSVCFDEMKRSSGSYYSKQHISSISYGRRRPEMLKLNRRRPRK